MALSLYAAVVPPFQQILRSVDGLLAKAEAYCAENGIAAEDIIQARLASDMLPFAYQVKSTTVHSLGAIEGVRNGVFSPDRSEPGTSFAALSDRLKQALAELDALDPAEVDGLVGRPMRFEIGSRFAEFSAEEFLLTFSKPNFYFHATTAYDILRMRGLAIGKGDYLGPIRFQPKPEA